jgi:hypothetical protein
MATESTNPTDTTNTTSIDMNDLTDEQLEVLPAPPSDRAAVASFIDGDGGTGEVSTEELERRRAEGLVAPFDDDDDDLDEDLRPTAEAVGHDSKPKPPVKADGNAEADEATTAGEKAAAEKLPATETARPEETAADPALVALHEAAERYGLEVDRFPTVEALEASVAAMDRMFHDIGAAELNGAIDARGNADRAEAEPSDRTSPPRPGIPTGGAGSEVRREGHGEAPLGKLDRLNREEYAPELIDALDEMRSVIAELRAENQSERNRRIEAANEAAEREIDSFFAEIAQDNPVWSETFGTAPAGELLRTTEGRKLLENRMNVLRARDNYAAGLESRRRPTPASRKLLESGLALAFREKLGEAAERKLARKLEGRHSGAPPRPTQRQSPRRDGGSALRDALKRHGMQPDES